MLLVAFANGSSGNIKLSKAQLSKMVQLGGFMFRALDPFKITGSLLNQNLNQWEKAYYKFSFYKILTNFIVDTRVNILGNEIKKGLSTVTVQQ